MTGEHDDRKAELASAEETTMGTRAQPHIRGNANGSAKPLSLTIERVLSRATANAEELLSDDVISFAVELPDIELARLKQRLAAARVRTQEFVREVQSRRKALAAVARRRRHEDPADNRPEITISVEEEDVNTAAVGALAQLENVYQRAGELVRVVEATRRKPGEEPYVVAEVRVITEPTLRELSSRAARWIERDADGGKKSSHPPEWCVRAVRARHSWPGIAPLFHVAEAPVLFSDGRVLQTAGYDRESGILCRTKFAVDLPDGPEWNRGSSSGLRAIARKAADNLLELVSEVPFESDAHRSSWLAALLTTVARWAFSGQAPLFMFDANREGVGKGMLVKIISGITLGRDCDLVIQTSDEEEERKRITSKVMAAQPIVLIDECEKPFGSPALQGLLTSGTWSDRLLGTNDSPSFDVSTVWFAAGNNVQYKSNDIRRRTCTIRLVTEEERPEQRTGYKIPDMDRHVRENRVDLFRSALTLVRAWLCSGLQTSDLPGWGGPWGLTGTWDRVVRGAIVFAGLPDPILTKATSVEPAAKDGLFELVLGLAEAATELGKDGEITTALLHSALVDNDEERAMRRDQWEKAPSIKFGLLRKGIHSLLPQLRGSTPSGDQLGKLLGKSKQQSVQADPTDASSRVRKWIASRWSNGSTRWRVEDVGTSTTDPVELAERAAIQSEGGES
jgi:hypothetical protein